MNEKSGFGRFGLQEPILQALDALGYHTPTEVQEQVLPLVLQGQDVIVQSQTGSGKTAAFGIPLCDRIVVEETRPQVLVLTPTRELAVQVAEEVAHIGRQKKVRTLAVYGKQPIHIQLRQLKQRVHVVVGTPGRLGDLVQRKNLDLSGIRFLVIDEADELLNRGFLEEVEAILGRIPQERCTLLFSATIPDRIREVCDRHMRTPAKVAIRSTEPTPEQIRQYWIEAADDWKFQKFLEVLEKHAPANCMVFCNTRERATQLADRLHKQGLESCLLHGGMPQKERLRSISSFKREESPLLVATDLAARGIHIDRLDLVVNYNVPTELENYVHRIGRTGRAGESGLAVSLVSVHEKAKWLEIQEYLGFTVPLEESGGPARPPKAGRALEKLKHKSPHKAPSKAAEKHRSVHKGISRIRINAGKNKKMRAGDILGALGSIPGIQAGDIGIIDIQDTCTYVEIFNDRGAQVAEGLAKTTVKGRTVKSTLLKN
ncbi:DEAD/DEAH box helicase [Clostridiales bacterium F-3ap]|uniref:DEAD/DEAH box helicase n=2 Tax=Anaerotalea alkaliphila TaxID=2662126 RepID=A0A7X5HV73_9FIRM|nr:DEAD/DEAH box helicase [Anaerotalea alkaliphila]